ncbi:hypothetical protein RND71_035191 [Anisodus tanguticus]|uniref:Protein kinase domain-containing protein n=1 Tax=Anisodus tanguticus TaxID=243964 RepID=A0AAE1R4F6_9SOLA|nr:hypothetical protein RND71_035191 [Anisodus tanguticus]
MRKTQLKSSRSSVNETRTPNKYDDSEGLTTILRSVTMHPGVSKQKMMAEDILRYGNVNISAEVFTFRELAHATDNFNPEFLVGEGGFGRVYKGHLKRTNQVVAVKQLDRNGVQGNREFLAEVLTLNLPSNKKPLDWYTRMKIAKGSAQGLEYLHDIANPPIIYRDFKASNVLLDESFIPKLSDFGLAKLGPAEGEDHVSTRVMGTYGYCAPEYAMTGQLTSKSDVYSFGVVLLEIISGRRAIDNTRSPEEQNLISWAKPLFKDKNMLTEMADPSLGGNYPVKGLRQALAIANMCLQEEANTRPLISDVVTALEYLAMQRDDEDTLITTELEDSACSDELCLKDLTTETNCVS